MSQTLSSENKPLQINQKKILAHIDDKIQTSKNPLFFFHDDPDGVCSYLIFYHYMKEGKGICVKSKAIVDARFLPTIRKAEPDTIFVLDLANISHDIINYCKTHKISIVWVDHHDIHAVPEIIYYNPKLDTTEINYPAALVSFEIIKQIIGQKEVDFEQHPLKDIFLWLSVAGSIGDWHIPYTIQQFKEVYPDLIDKVTDNPPEIMFDTPFSEIITFLSFALKGSTTKVNKNIEYLRQISSPYEITRQSSEPAQKVYANIKPFLQNFRELYERIESKIKDEESRLFFFEYESDKLSVSSMISNEILYSYPEKVSIIARHKDDEIRGSIRSATVPVRDALMKTMVHVDGSGGGHEFACGFSVKNHDKEKFLTLLEQNLFG